MGNSKRKVVMKILVTGAAGFIGYHTATRLHNDGHEVHAADRVGPQQINRDRWDGLHHEITPAVLDLTDMDDLDKYVHEVSPEVIIHLAASAGVRDSINDPQRYIMDNIFATTNVFDVAARCGVKHVIYASSSSVYGDSAPLPSSESDRCDDQESPYAVTKRACELMAQAYGNTHGLRTTGLRFFTVYGPWGRPDMAPYIFANKSARGEGMEVYDNENMQRDFTYIDDVVECIQRIIDPDNVNEVSEIINVGKGHPDMVNKLAGEIGRHSNNPFICMDTGRTRKGDVTITHACTKRLQAAINYVPSTPLTEGIAKFIEWHKDYHKEMWDAP
jgi:UDP-glucuronate 4-epimerase